MVHNEVVSGSQHINGQHLKKAKMPVYEIMSPGPKFFSCSSELRHTEHVVSTAHKN